MWNSYISGLYQCCDKTLFYTNWYWKYSVTKATKVNTRTFDYDVCIHAHVHSSLCEEEQRFSFLDKGIPVLRRLRTTLGLIPPLSTPLPPPHVSTCPLITVVFSGLLSCLFLPVLYSISHKAASNLKTLTWCHIQLCICWGNTLTETACSG